MKLTTCVLVTTVSMRMASKSIVSLTGAVKRTRSSFSGLTPCASGRIDVWSTAGSGDTVKVLLHASRSVPCWLAACAVSATSMAKGSPKGSGDAAVKVITVLASFQAKDPSTDGMPSFHRLNASCVLARSMGWLKVTTTGSSGGTRIPTGFAPSTMGAELVKPKAYGSLMALPSTAVSGATVTLKVVAAASGTAGTNW